MTTPSAFFVQTYYSGTVAVKLAVARELYDRHVSSLLASPAIREGLGRLRRLAFDLEGHMQSMELGRLCSRCAARPAGGCCSAFMADNTDSILLLINLLLGVKVRRTDSGEENCGFLGAQGCLFLVKPIFCLNYNCKNILDSTNAGSLEGLYRLAAAVLSQQTGVETLLLDALSVANRNGKPENPPAKHNIP